MMCACYSCLRITAVESLSIRGLRNSSARTCEINMGVFSNVAAAIKRPQCPESHLRVETGGPSLESSSGTVCSALLC